MYEPEFVYAPELLGCMEERIAQTGWVDLGLGRLDLDLELGRFHPELGVEKVSP